nr:TetR/AcrR family transcriptional regulator [Zhihengliuella flava]
MDTSTSGSPETDGRSARWDAHREARRLELLRHARKAIHRLGPSASMDDVAAAAGTSKSVFYRYFGDKSGLRRAMGRIVVEHMREHVLEPARLARNEEEGLRGMVAAYLTMAERSPNVYFFVTAIDHDPLQAVQEDDDEPLDAFFRDITVMMADSLTDYQARAHPDRAESRRADMLWPQASIGMVRAAGEAWLRLPDGPTKVAREDLTNTITGWLVHGIRHTETKGSTHE